VIPLVCIPAERKVKSLQVCAALAIGAGGGVVVDPARYAYSLHAPALIFGSSPRSLKLLGEIRNFGHREWCYADGAYGFGRGSHFRVTRGALQITPDHPPRSLYRGARPDLERFRRFRVPVMPWRHTGGPVVVVTQSDLWHLWNHGKTAAAWADQVAASIRSHTDRPIEICSHKGGPRFDELLPSAWCVVTHSSAAAVTALLAGVPVFGLAGRDEFCAATLALSDLSFIETPFYPDGREEWAALLAANQWTVDEMRDGKTWKALRYGD
jgi:hypothetical protein